MWNSYNFQALRGGDSGMTNEMKLVKISITDISNIVKLLKNNNLPFKDIPSKTDHLFLGCIQGTTVGVGGVKIYGRYGLLRSLVIKEPYRKKGNGKKLCNQLTNHAKQRGVDELYLLTTTAVPFFEKMEFHQIDRSEVPKIIQKTSEFTSLCPATAICMKRVLH
jgi:amino-acid N-acetyltransferase